MPADTRHDPQTRDDLSPLATDILDRLIYRIGKDAVVATEHDWLTAAVLVVRDRVVDRWMTSTRDAYQNQKKRVYYLSAEFLIGRLLRDAVSNMEMMQSLCDALVELGVSYDTIEALEPDAALGNGGLGRLAACFMESMASVDIPAYGYGIRYVHGLFHQDIRDGWQVEFPETWLQHGNPWEFPRREASYEIGFGGHVQFDDDDRCHWAPQERYTAEAYDTPIVGWQGKRVNTLRLWKAEPLDPIRLEVFNAGDHLGAMEDKNRAEALSRVLYPADETPAGQELRLRQEYFFSSASLQDILRRHLQQYDDLSNLADKVAVQLNDTHPAISVAELMRLLMDVHHMPFDTAWEITKKTFAYTNHTLLPEALESWPVPLLERMLPRHMQIIFQINATVLKEARTQGFGDGDIADMSLIDEGGERRVRMGNLAFVGAHSVNGVSGLHTELMKKTVFRPFHQLYPLRINNKTNGITPRRWLAQANPEFYALAQEVVGDRLLGDLDTMTALDVVAEDGAFQQRFRAIKRANKARMADEIKAQLGLTVSPDAMFDVQIKRIHEYKRQLLNIIETVALYDQMRSHPERDWVPRVKLFAGKAAPSYHNAKLIIKLAGDVARAINRDPSVRDLLRVAYMPNYNVTLAEKIVPSADLSEQISTAGMEASGTGNMKFALNGALTIGTLDGANVEIKERVGDDNIVIFGMTADEVAQTREQGHDANAIIEGSKELAQAVHAIEDGVFSPSDPGRYRDLMAGLRHSDWFMVAADFEAYAAAQRDVDALWQAPDQWTAKAIRNAARVGYFSSDRTIRQYAHEIWGVPA
ncbi:MAG: glycogen/starch/alpha-glucan phosphorylase [Pseudomonadota bacterium]